MNNIRSRRLAAILVGGFVVFGLASPAVYAKPKTKNDPFITPAKPITKPQKQEMPKVQDAPLPDAPNDSVCFFNFRCNSSDSDAAFYSRGFVSALSDRLHYAPATLTLQVPDIEISQELSTYKIASSKDVSDKDGAEIAKNLGAKYAVTGDFSLIRDSVTIDVHLSVASTGKSLPVIHAAGSTVDLPKIQTELAQKIVHAMGLNLSQDQLDELKKPNFSQARTLLLASQITSAKEWKDKELYCWQAVSQDTQSTFAVEALLKAYLTSNLTTEQLKSNVRLMEIVRDSTGQFPDNESIRLEKAQLLCAKLQDSSTGKGILSMLLLGDHRMMDAHDWSLHLTEQSGDLSGALSEAESMIAIWPTRAKYYVYMANTYGELAAQARQDRAYAEMSKEDEQAWYDNSMQAVELCRTATRLDKDCSEAWHILLNLGRELSLSNDVGNAFKELTRINPKDWQAYYDYAVCFSPQWKGLPAQQEAVFVLAERAFGKDSEQVLLLRIWSVWQNSDRADHLKDILDNTDKVLALQKQPSEDLLSLKYHILEAQKRYTEMSAVSEKAYGLYPSPTWRFDYATDLARSYRETNDTEKLKKAVELFCAYVADYPDSVDGHLNYGWCLEKLGLTSEANAEYQKADELASKNQPAANQTPKSAGQPTL